MAAGSVAIPPKYLNPDGQIKLGAPYSERDFTARARSRSSTFERETPCSSRTDPGSRGTSWRTIPSTSWDGTGWCILTRSTPTTSSRSPVPSTSRPPVQQTFEPPGFVVCTSPRACSTPTPRRSRCRTPIPTCSRTRSCTTYAAGSAARRGVEEASITLHPAASPTARTPARSSPARTPPGPTSWPSWSTPSAPRLTRQALGLDDPSYPLSWID